MNTYKIKLTSLIVILLFSIIVSGMPMYVYAQSESPMVVLNNNSGTDANILTNSIKPTNTFIQEVSDLPAIQQGNSVVFTIGSDIVTDNGTQYQIDVAPFIDNNGRTQVPVRYLADALGVTNIGYNSNTRLVSMLFGDNQTNIALTIGSNKMYVGNSTVTMDTVPVIVPPGRTMLPARFIAEALGDTVNWNSATQQVTITVPATSTSSNKYTYGVPDANGYVFINGAAPGSGAQDPNTGSGFIAH